MSGKSSIQWTDRTWNPTTGCTRVSAGCDHCYAFQLHDQRHIAWKRGRWPSAPAQYHEPFSKVQLLHQRLSDPLHWREPSKIFVDSMSDLFHEDVPDAYIEWVFGIMAECPHHTFQVLTKRPERMREWVRTHTHSDCPWPLPNVWLGTSVENQAAAHERIPHLLATPAAVRFLSCEPLLGPVDLTHWISDSPEQVEHNGAHYGESNPLHWVIIGGESGPHARPMDLRWARDVMDQAEEGGARVFVKQMGSVWAKEWEASDLHGGDENEWDDDFRVRMFPRTGKEAGQP